MAFADSPRHDDRVSAAVALHGTGDPAGAIAVLEESHQRRPTDRDVLTALVSYLRERGDSRGALRYAERLATLSHDDREAQGLVQALRSPVGPSGALP